MSPYWMGSEEYEVEANLERQAAAEADAVITLTAAMKRELVSRGVPAEKIVVVPNSVDPHLFKPLSRDPELEQLLGLDNQPVVGYVGTFAPYEGLDDLLHAACIVIDRGVNLRLLLVGDGREMKRIRALVADLELEKEVILTGRVPFEEVQRYYSLIDVAAFPRKPQPVTEIVSPLKPFEAMAMEKAVLVSSVAALAEIVRAGETGIVFEKGNIDDLADQLELLMNDAELRRRMGRNAREWVITNRTWERAGAQVVELYRSLTDRC